MRISVIYGGLSLSDVLPVYIYEVITMSFTTKYH